jgi:hypothetical protein
LNHRSMFRSIIQHKQNLEVSVLWLCRLLLVYNAVDHWTIQWFLGLTSTSSF